MCAHVRACVRACICVRAYACGVHACVRASARADRCSMAWMRCVPACIRVCTHTSVCAPELSAQHHVSGCCSSRLCPTLASRASCVCPRATHVGTYANTDLRACVWMHVCMKKDDTQAHMQARPHLRTRRHAGTHQHACAHVEAHRRSHSCTEGDTDGWRQKNRQMGECMDTRAHTGTYVQLQHAWTHIGTDTDKQRSARRADGWADG